MSFPTAVVLDLDYTLWPFWCDTHISMPLRAHTKDTAIDAYGTRISFFKDVAPILKELKDNNVVIIAASRTYTPNVAKRLLTLLHVGDKPAIEFFDSLQWGTGSKIKHIKNAARELGLEDELKDGKFILFDDEGRNRDVESIGCHFMHIKDESKGLTMQIYKSVLDGWAKN